MDEANPTQLEMVSHIYGASHAHLAGDRARERGHDYEAAIKVQPKEPEGDGLENSHALPAHVVLLDVVSHTVKGLCGVHVMKSRCMVGFVLVLLQVLQHINCLQEGRVLVFSWKSATVLVLESSVTH